jgi:hypothetical protein
MEKGLEAVEKEIAAEKAAALGHSARKLRAALDKLQRFDEIARAGDRRTREPSSREKLVEAAGEALWAYVVQREAIGLIDADYIRKEYSVPADVWQHMSPKIEAAARERESPGSPGARG